MLTTYMTEKVNKIIYEEGTIVEIDEACISGKRKYNTGRKLDQIWLLGMKPRSRSQEVVVHLLNNRKASEMIPIIKHHCKATVKAIHTDCHKSYNTLTNEGYVHGTVNHSKYYVN